MSEKLKMEADPARPETMKFEKEETYSIMGMVSRSFTFPCHCCAVGKVTVVLKGDAATAYHRVTEDLTSPETIKMAVDAYKSKVGKTEP